MKKKSQLLLVLLMICMTMCFAPAIPVAAATPAKPTITVVKKSTDTSVWIKWAQAKNAKKYELFCSVDGGAYKKIAVTMKLYYKHTGLKPGSTYSYKLRASNGTNKSKYSAVKKYKVPKKNIYKASTNSVYLTKTQNSKRITVTYSGPSCTVRFKSSDTDVADCEWDEDWIGDTIGLTITGYKKGSCTITLTNTADSQKVQIYVDVDFPTTNEYIGFEVNDITLKVGETKTVNVKTDNGFALRANRSNQCISIEWKDWLSETNTIPISITGISSGESVLTVYDDRDDSIFAKLAVTVVGDEDLSAFDKIVKAMKSGGHVNTKGQPVISESKSVLENWTDNYGVVYYEEDESLELIFTSISPTTSEMTKMTIRRSDLDKQFATAKYTGVFESGSLPVSYKADLSFNKSTYLITDTPSIVITERLYTMYLTDAEMKKMAKDHFTTALAMWNALLKERTGIPLTDLGFRLFNKS